MSDTFGPALTDADFHPDHPAPTGWLILDLHNRLLAIEAKLGIDKVVAKTEGVVHTVGEDVVNAFHKVEDALGISHS